MRIVVGPRYAFLESTIAQLITLVFFSYTFFFEGITGLTITILCIVLLFIAMQTTAKIDWSEKFDTGKKLQIPKLKNKDEVMDAKIKS